MSHVPTDCPGGCGHSSLGRVTPDEALDGLEGVLARCEPEAEIEALRARFERSLSSRASGSAQLQGGKRIGGFDAKAPCQAASASEPRDGALSPHCPIQP